MSDYDYRFARLEKIIEALMVLLPDDKLNSLKNELCEMNIRRSDMLEGYTNEN